jgi:large subunit ribosomal protein L4
VVFGPKPRDFGKKVNAKTKQLALRRALTNRLNAGDVLVLDDLKLTAPKTKEFLGVLRALQLLDATVLVCAAADQNLRLASRNVPGVDVTSGDTLNTYQVLRYDKLVFTRTAFEKVEQRLK